MAALGPGPSEQSCRLLLLFLTVHRVGSTGCMGAGRRVVRRPLGSVVMIGNDGAEDTWDNDGVANSPDDKMKAQNRGVHLVTPAGTMTGLKARTACVCVCVPELVWTTLSIIGKFQTYSISSPFHWKLLIKMSCCSPMLLWTGFWPSHKYSHTHTNTHTNPWLWVWEWHQC